MLHVKQSDSIHRTLDNWEQQYTKSKPKNRLNTFHPVQSSVQIWLEKILFALFDALRSSVWLPS